MKMEATEELQSLSYCIFAIDREFHSLFVCCILHIFTVSN